ncbi:MAG TPA: hypothetical protein VMD29_01995 [Terracidiphilus sp.]|nr:hypothetical protein [Terracidiphilus sp.]
MLRFSFVIVLLLRVGACAAQTPMNMGGAATTPVENVLRHSGSGTDLEPGSSVPPMLMKMTSSQWMLMLHGDAWITEQHQTGPRGHDKLFSTNWVMPMAQRQLGAGQVTLRAMFSLEPATVSGRFYPELFQQGETAFGKPIQDGQHPHNLFMELAGFYDRKLGSHAVATVYGGPVGDPALGPEAFPHRPSASEDPIAPLGHHLEDSTHIAWDVVTGGVTVGDGHLGARLEASGFHGREPDENRWHIEAGAVDSWSARLSVLAGKDWVGQYSLGRLHSPEVLHPAEDVLRQTASLTWHHAFSGVTANGITVWGRNHTVGTTEKANGYLAEMTLWIRNRQSVWTRLENADRTTDLLPNPPAEETVVGRVPAWTFGYAHRLWGWSDGRTEIGAQYTGYRTPDRLIQYYGEMPWGVAAVVKVQVGKGRH